MRSLKIDPLAENYLKNLRIISRNLTEGLAFSKEK